MGTRMRAIVSVASFLLTALLGQEPTPPDPATLSDATRAGWRADLRFLRSEIERLHPDPFRTHPREQWDLATATLEQQLPRLDIAGFVLGLMRLVKLAEDGHTTLMPVGAPEFTRTWPIAFWTLADGLSVRAVDPRYRDLLGCRITAIAGVPTADVSTRVRSVSFGDDPAAPGLLHDRLLSYPALLVALGIGEADKPMALRCERPDGTAFDVALEPPPVDPAAAAPSRAGWLDAAPAERQLFLRHPEQNYWFEELPAERALYCRFRQVVDQPERPFAAFCTELFARWQTGQCDKLVIDLRGNTGGNNTILQPLVHGLIRAERLHEPGRLFVLTNRFTFSAAVNCAARIERETPALFVGEPTGAGANHFGDATAVRLPNTGWLLRVSTLRWQDSDPRDARRAIVPDLPAPMTLVDFREGRDPALAAALAYRPEANAAAIDPVRRWARPGQAPAQPR